MTKKQEIGVSENMAPGMNRRIRFVELRLLIAVAFAVVALAQPWLLTSSNASGYHTHTAAAGKGAGTHHHHASSKEQTAAQPGDDGHSHADHLAGKACEAHCGQPSALPDDSFITTRLSVRIVMPSAALLLTEEGVDAPARPPKSLLS